VEKVKTAVAPPNMRLIRVQTLDHGFQCFNYST